MPKPPAGEDGRQRIFGRPGRSGRHVCKCVAGEFIAGHAGLCS